MAEYEYGTVVSFSLVITGEKLDFDDINRMLKLQPSKLVRKGEIRSKVIGEALHDIWSYEIKSEVNGEPDKTLKHLLGLLLPANNYIKELSKSVDLYLKCYIQSDYAQIGFGISPEVLNKLAEIGVRLEFSILSWGGVENDSSEEDKISPEENC